MNKFLSNPFKKQVKQQRCRSSLKIKGKTDLVFLDNQARLYKENYLDNKQQFLKQNKRKGYLNTATASRNGSQLTVAACANSDRMAKKP